MSVIKNISLETKRYTEVQKPDDLEFFNQDKTDILDVDFAFYLSEWSDARTVCYSNDKTKNVLHTNRELNNSSRNLQSYEGERRVFDMLRTSMSEKEFVKSKLLGSLISQKFPPVIVLNQPDLELFLVEMGYEALERRVIDEDTFVLLKHPEHENYELKLDPELVLEKIQKMLDTYNYQKAGQLLEKCKGIEFSRSQQILFHRLVSIASWYLGNKVEGLKSCEWGIENIKPSDFTSQEVYEQVLGSFEQNYVFYLPKLTCVHPSVVEISPLGFFLGDRTIPGQVTPHLTLTEEGFQVEAWSRTNDGNVKTVHQLSKSLEWLSAECYPKPENVKIGNVEYVEVGEDVYVKIGGHLESEPIEVLIKNDDGYITTFNGTSLEGYERSTNSVQLEKSHYFIASRGKYHRFVKMDTNEFVLGPKFVTEKEPHNLLLVDNVLYLVHGSTSSFSISKILDFASLAESINTT